MPYAQPQEAALLSSRKWYEPFRDAGGVRVPHRLEPVQYVQSELLVQFLPQDVVSVIETFVASSRPRLHSFDAAKMKHKWAKIDSNADDNVETCFMKCQPQTIASVGKSSNFYLSVHRSGACRAYLQTKSSIVISGNTADDRIGLYVQQHPQQNAYLFTPCPAETTKTVDRPRQSVRVSFDLMQLDLKYPSQSRFFVYVPEGSGILAITHKAIVSLSQKQSQLFDPSSEDDPFRTTGFELQRRGTTRILSIAETESFFPLLEPGYDYYFIGNRKEDHLMPSNCFLTFPTASTLGVHDWLKCEFRVLGNTPAGGTSREVKLYYTLKEDASNQTIKQLIETPYSFTTFKARRRRLYLSFSPQQIVQVEENEAVRQYLLLIPEHCRLSLVSVERTETCKRRPAKQPGKTISIFAHVPSGM